MRDAQAAAALEQPRLPEQSGTKSEYEPQTLVLQWACRGKFSPTHLRDDLASGGDQLIPTGWFLHIFCWGSC